MVALPGELFTNTQIPACIWFLTKSKEARSIRTGDDPVGTFYRDRRGETLFIDARKLGFMKDRVLRDFTPEDIEKIAGTFREWRFDDSAWRTTAEGAGCTLPAEPGSQYKNVPGFCKSATLAEIARTASSSRRAATSARKTSKTMASRSRKRWRALLRS
jgi:type I restriction enzyme M protein